MRFAFWNRSAARIAGSLGLLSLLLLPSAGAQQTNVDKYDLYGGFTSFSTPHLNLTERGFNFQAGQNVKTWLSMGFDYSIVSGHTTLTPSMLKSSEQQVIAGFLAANGLAGYPLQVPTNSSSQTFAFGPQLAYRHYERFTLFARPAIGAVRQTATPRPQGPIETAAADYLAPSGQKIDWQGFYGFGGGVDWNATRHFGLRMQADLVYWHLFNDLLDGEWTVRYSVGPTFHFGRNIAAPPPPPPPAQIAH